MAKIEIGNLHANYRLINRNEHKTTENFAKKIKLIADQINRNVSKIRISNLQIRNEKLTFFHLLCSILNLTASLQLKGSLMTESHFTQRQCRWSTSPNFRIESGGSLRQKKTQQKTLNLRFFFNFAV